MALACTRRNGEQGDRFVHSRDLRGRPQVEGSSELHLSQRLATEWPRGVAEEGSKAWERT